MKNKLKSSIENSIRDALRRPLKTYISDFLDESEQALANEILSKTNREYKFDGGFEDASRKILIIAPENLEIEKIKVPLSAIIFDKPGELAHRNILGTFMSLGVERDTIGDICIWEDTVQVVVVKRLSEYFNNNLSYINSHRIEPELFSYKNIIPYELQFEIENGTSASNRLDAISATIFKTSRNKAAEAIKKGLVLLNHLPELKITTEVKEGDTLSMRGKGKVKIDHFDGKTKKDRIRYTYKRYK